LVFPVIGLACQWPVIGLSPTSAQVIDDDWPILGSDGAVMSRRRQVRQRVR
jgi:hypothetical protein